MMWRDEVGILEMLFTYINQYEKSREWSDYRNVLLNILSFHETFSRMDLKLPGDPSVIPVDDDSPSEPEKIEQDYAPAFEANPEATAASAASEMDRFWAPDGEPAMTDHQAACFSQFPDEEALEQQRISASNSRSRRQRAPSLEPMSRPIKEEEEEEEKEDALKLEEEEEAARTWRLQQVCDSLISAGDGVEQPLPPLPVDSTSYALRALGWSSDLGAGGGVKKCSSVSAAPWAVPAAVEVPAAPPDEVKSEDDDVVAVEPPGPAVARAQAAVSPVLKPSGSPKPRPQRPSTLMIAGAQCERVLVSRRLFTCNYCLKTFNDPSNKLRHERIHTKEKPYACAHCPKTFRQSTHKKRHERQHAREAQLQALPHAPSQFTYNCDVKFSATVSGSYHSVNSQSFG